jgi:hypothetical protein
MILLTMESPIPAPSYSPMACNLLNTSKILSKYWSSIPMPLSLIEKICSLSSFFAEMWIFGVSSFFRNFKALSIRFWNTFTI